MARNSVRDALKTLKQMGKEITAEMTEEQLLQILARAQDLYQTQLDPYVRQADMIRSVWLDFLETLLKQSSASPIDRENVQAILNSYKINAASNVAEMIREIRRLNEIVSTSSQLSMEDLNKMAYDVAAFHLRSFALAEQTTLLDTLLSTFLDNAQSHLAQWPMIQERVRMTVAHARLKQWKRVEEAGEDPL